MKPGSPIRWLLIVCFVIACPHSSRAEDELSRMWQDVLRNPADVRLGFRYADRLVVTEHFGEAAAELERLLMIEPSQPQVKLELGVLYFRMKQYGLARAYLLQTLDEPGLTPAVRERVEYFAAESGRRAERGQLAGSVSFGGRFQSNANGGTGRDLLTSTIGSIPVSPNLRQRSDVNAFVSGEISHSYDLDLQREAAIVTSASGLVTRQTDPYFYNLSGLTARSGVRFAIAPETAPGLTLYPYALADLLLLNDKFYNFSAGAGSEFRLQVTDNLTISMIGEGKSARFDNVPKIATAHQLSGHQGLALLRAVYRASPILALYGQIGNGFFNTNQPFYSYTEFEATLGLAMTYAPPIRLTPTGQWTLAVSGSYLTRPYGGPDPAVDITRTRKEQEWRLQVTNEVPISPAWGWFQSVEYRNVSANIANYNRDNVLVSTGLTRRF